MENHPVQNGVAAPAAGAKKLRRGLEDLSPLFRHTEVQPVPLAVPFRPAFDVQFLAVSVPDHEGDSFLANAYLASQLVRQTDLFASLVSIAPGFNGTAGKTAQDPFPSLELLNPKISRLVLSHQALWSLTQANPLRREGEAPSSETTVTNPVIVLLDFEPAHFRSLARIAQLLDRVVLYVQPEGDSLREAYRTMKTLWNLNREIDFFLLFRDGLGSRDQGEFLFERFSLITSRFLGISTVWLGGLAFPEKKDPVWVPTDEILGFHSGAILSGEGLRRPLSPEKTRFWRWFQKMLQSRTLEGAKAAP
ncbi:MAG: hypothetical protein HYU34_01605 [Candidatus Omnitrophica bacterium]|nr:hypothetical protein [Candidatus Omnitrophota bacterium]